MIAFAPQWTRKARRMKKRKPDEIDRALTRFEREHGVSSGRFAPSDRGKLFEYMSAFYILRRFHVPDLEVAELDRLIIGGQHDNQLDCLAIVLDGAIVDDEAEIDAALAAGADEIDARVIFVQATLEKFGRPKIMHFVNSVDSFCSPAPEFMENDALKRKRALKDHLLKAAETAEVALSPSVFGYFAARGEWLEDNPDFQNKVGEFKRGRRVVGGAPWVKAVEFEAVDKNRLLNLVATGPPGVRAPEIEPIQVEDYEAALPADGLIALPAVPGGAVGFQGHVRVGDYLALLEREDGQGLREAAFHLNVRGFQVQSQVNRRIRETLSGPDRGQFVLRNNGVAIVADDIVAEGARIRLTNFQVVNGLQTSNVIYQMREELRAADDVHVAVKIVSGLSQADRVAIIDATNRQTPIRNALMFAASAKAIELERHFAGRVAAAGGTGSLLERRHGQFGAQEDVAFVTLEDMLRAFYAVFLRKSHIAEGGFERIRQELDETHLFGAHVPNEAYYAAALLLQFVRRIANERDVARLDAVELHAALGLAIVCAPQDPPLSDRAGLVDYCVQIERRLAVAAHFNRLAHCVEEATLPARNRMKSGRRNVPEMKNTMDEIVRRARNKAREMAPPE